MKSTIRNFNIVLKKEGLLAHNVEIDKIKSAIITVLESAQPPMVHQLPDVLVFIIPDYSLSITFQHETILISDNSTNQVAAQIDKFIPLVIEIEKNCKGKLFAYGFNYTIEATLEKNTTKVLQGLLNQEVLNEKNLIGPKLISPQIKIRSKHNGYSTGLTLTPHLSENNADTHLLSAQYNHHYKKLILPAFDVLKADYLARYDEFDSLITKLDE